MCIEDIALTLALKPEQLPNKIESRLALPFAKSAALTQDYELVIALLKQEKAAHLLSAMDEIIQLLQAVPKSIQQDLVALMITPLSQSNELDPMILSSLYRLIESPLPKALATQLLNSKAFKASYKRIMSLNNGGDSVRLDALAVMASLMPPTLHSDYQAATAELPFNSSNDPQPYLAFITQLNHFRAKETDHD